VNIIRETVRKMLTEGLGMRKVCKNGPKGPVHLALSVREFLASKQITVLLTGLPPVPFSFS
jgi:hypothetical protein